MKIRSLDFVPRALRQSRLARDLRQRTETLRESRFARDLRQRTESVVTTTAELVRGLLDKGLGPAAEAPRKSSAPPPAPEPSANGSLASHLGFLVEKRLAKLGQCRHWRTADDPVEAVHDLRVASRRLRAFVDVFAPLLDSEIIARTEKPLRKITRAARSVRDLDVQAKLLTTWLERATTDAERAALEHLLEELGNSRERTCRRAEKRLAKIDFDDLGLSISAALGSTIARLPSDRASTAALAHELIGPLIQRASKDRPADDGVEYPDEMHRLRIDLKRLRYGIELFEPVFGDGYTELYERVEGLQELLGDHHDLVVLGDIVEAHRKVLERKDRQTLLVGLSTLQDQLMNERRRLSARFRAEGFEPDWWERSVQGALAEH